MRGMGFGLAGFSQGLRQGEGAMQRKRQSEQEAEIHPIRVEQAQEGLAGQKEQRQRASDEYLYTTDKRAYQDQFDKSMRAYVASRGENYQPLVDMYNTQIPDGHKLDARRHPDGTFDLFVVDPKGAPKPVGQRMSFEDFGRAAMEMQDPSAVFAAPEKVKLREGEAMYQGGKEMYRNPKSDAGGAGGRRIGPMRLTDADLRAQHEKAVRQLIPDTQHGLEMKARLDSYKRKYGEDEGLDRWVMEIDNMPPYREWVAINHGYDPFTGERVGDPAPLQLPGRGLPGAGDQSGEANYPQSGEVKLEDGKPLKDKGGTPITWEDIHTTAAKHGMTVDEVLERLEKTL